MSDLFKRLAALGAISSLSLHFARAMGRIASEEDERVLLAAALASHQLGSGHVCFHVPSATAKTFGIGGIGGGVGSGAGLLPLPERKAWLEALLKSSLVSDGSVKTPLVLDEDGWLYLHRYWEHEQILAAYIKRGASVQEEVDGPLLAQGLDRLFGPSSSEEFDHQRLSALVAVRRRFSVISGGPGTGKTYTVVKILALLIEQALAAGLEPPLIRLVAPTGKAAARLVESIKKAKSELSCSDEVRQAIVDEASTIHRCLGSVRGSSTVFRHHANNRLVADVILVDEASMANLGLMRRLVEAMPATARLILLGDMDQLASVEAGAVLGDICNAGSPRHFSAALASDVRSLTGDIVPLTAESPSNTGIWDCVTKLCKSYRFDSDSGIAELARAINEGDASRAFAALEGCEEVSMVESAAPGSLGAELTRSAIEGFGPYLQEGLSPKERLEAFDTFRVLCPRRTGAFGATAINTLLCATLERAGLIRVGHHVNFCGRPVLVTANTYELGLYNGDIGIVWSDDGDGVDEPSSLGLRAYFLAADGSERAIAPGRLPSAQTVYAMSVHKSQGSEFDHVAIVLPEDSSPIMTREILYTAVTRAKKRVTIHGSRDVLATAIARQSERSSGLRRALWGAEKGS